MMFSKKKSKGKEKLDEQTQGIELQEIKMNLNRLPIEIKDYLFQFFDPKSAARGKQVCKEFKDIVEINEIREKMRRREELSKFSAEDLKKQLDDPQDAKIIFGCNALLNKFVKFAQLPTFAGDVLFGHLKPLAEKHPDGYEAGMVSLFKNKDIFDAYFGGRERSAKQAIWCFSGISLMAKKAILETPHIREKANEIYPELIVDIQRELSAMQQPAVSRGPALN
jgi:hypothetical protein